MVQRKSIASMFDYYFDIDDLDMDIYFVKHHMTLFSSSYVCLFVVSLSYLE